MEKDELAQEKKVLTAEERRAQIKAEKEKIRKRFQGIDKSLLDVIPADEIPNFFEDTSEKRVCAYNRVSTDNLQQVSSIEIQQTTNEQTIREHPGWNLVKIYTDEGISGTSIEHRTGFQEMLRDCEAGLIDVIIVKSVSRFARNLVDCVNIVRKLKYAKHPVGVFFETEHIFSLDGNSEMFLNMMAMLAQSESQNKADVMNDSIEKRFRLGLFLTPPLLGYDRGADGNLVLMKKMRERRVLLKLKTVIVRAHSKWQIGICSQEPESLRSIYLNRKCGLHHPVKTDLAAQHILRYCSIPSSA